MMYRVEGSVIEVVIKVTHESVEHLSLGCAFSEVAVGAPVRGGHLLDGVLVAVSNIGEPDVVGKREGEEDANDVSECVEHDGSFQRGLMFLIIRLVVFAKVKAYNPCYWVIGEMISQRGVIQKDHESYP